MIFNRRVTALVPIKEESERVPGKNFRDFAGEPLFHHIIRTLDRTYAVDEVVIDTDSHRVIREAPDLSPKVKVIERPEELRGHKVSTNRIFAYDLTQVESDVFVQTHVTNPLLQAETIAEALRLFVEKEEEHDSLFGVNVYHSRFYHDDGTAINHAPDDMIPTQEL
ncbi:MAG: acylneuraminate cytidylyltransferase family protein, partial [Lentisphaerae bacterium]|nr:acylneuraminate cytidylyltransferase family protein [Lentisphaerota bacterium]